MGKHKIIKSAAAVALTASVVATAAAPGASAASYKTNAKDQLVHTSTGKLVKGWKVFGGKLYKNGNLAPAKKYKIIGTGAAQRLYFGPTLKKGYKTAASKTLLFKDGKLADGWKQAGKNERLYKNGKLDKGYTVFNDVEGEKFLYQNGKLKKGLKTAKRGGVTNLFLDGKVAQGLVEFGGKFYNNGTLAQGTIAGKEYKDGVVVVATAEFSAKSTNATTVEVAFNQNIKAEDIKAENFTIEGLTVSNAVVKQSDAKTVILTTSTQEAGKEYAVSYKGSEGVKFVAINNSKVDKITATTIKPYQTSQQSKVGAQVTVKAQVTVAEGQSKAGIPVTFNIDAVNDKATGTVTNFNEDRTVEVLTDANGVASYTYTQYHAGLDTVYAYPTGVPTKRADLTKVYWDVSQPLTVTPEADTSSVANDSKQVYKVQVSPEFVKAAQEQGLKVTFAENYNVNPEKVNYDAKVANGKAADDKEFVTPYQTSINGKQEVKLEVNAKGEATFTVKGANTSVTPVVYIDGPVYNTSNDDAGITNGKLDLAELQVTAPVLKFDNIKTVGLTHAAVSPEQKASRSAFTLTELKASKGYDENYGGRTYQATLKDKDGNTAPANTTVYLTFTDDEKNPTEYVVFDRNAGDVLASEAATQKNTNKTYELKTDAKGQVTYTIVAAKQANDNNSANGGTNYGYATPVVYLDNNSNTPNGKIDTLDTQANAEISYFGDAVIEKAVLAYYVGGKEVTDLTKLPIGTDVTVKYQTIDQNQFPYAPAKEATAIFGLDTTFADLVDIEVVNEAGKTIQVITGNTNSGISAKLNAEGQAFLKFKVGNESTVNVSATSSEKEIATTKADKLQFVKTTTGGNTNDTEATLAIKTINSLNGKATKDTYDKAGITGVTAANLDRVQDEVAAAKIVKGADLTKAEIQAAVNKVTGETKPTAPTETAKAYTDAVAAIPALAADKSNKAAVEAAIATAEEAAKALTAADKATEAVTAADKTLAAAKDSVKDEAPVETAKTVADLVTAGALTLTKGSFSQNLVIADKTKLPTDLQAATAFTLVFADKTTADITLESDGKPYIAIQGKTEAQIKEATLTVTASK